MKATQPAARCVLNRRPRVAHYASQPSPPAARAGREGGQASGGMAVVEGREEVNMGGVVKIKIMNLRSL